MITDSNEACISEFKRQMKKEFEMTDIGQLSYFLGIEFVRCSRGFVMHRKRYATNILKRFDMVNCNHAVTPYEPRLQLSKCEDENSVDTTKFRSLIGSLRYLCNTRPNLVYSVEILSRFMDKPKVSHLAVLKRILRYVKGTIDCGIVFPACDVGLSLKLTSFSDASWCGDEKTLIEEITVEASEAVTIKIDNVSAINVVKNPISHGRSKHIELRFHYLRDRVTKVC
ncbi:hypothetical protein QL285_051773 [Trifolium repens]|jgi:hypothetical protein|nr:hypothetical protein QL285_051773 [Trifolium repens]